MSTIKPRQPQSTNQTLNLMELLHHDSQHTAGNDQYLVAQSDMAVYVQTLKVSNDQEMAQSEKTPTPKPSGKNLH